MPFEELKVLVGEPLRRMEKKGEEKRKQIQLV